MNCKNCNRPVPTWSRTSQRRDYCNRSCRATAEQRRRAESRAEMNRVSLVCRFCPETFETGKANRQHCGSDACRRAYNAERARKQRHALADRLAAQVEQVAASV